MNYKETLDWMFAQLPMFQRQGKDAFKKDLTNTIEFSVHLNHPEKQFKTIMWLEPMEKVQQAI